jgi:hypothetical protein
MSSSSSFGRTIFQGFVIIIAVMLAYGADNLWNDQALKKDELDSLELVLRDLGDSVNELQEFSDYSAGAFDAALGAYSALSKRAPYDKGTIRSNLLRVDRYTLDLPSSAYTDLLSTGELSAISNRNLRDAIVRFYEAAEHHQAIVERNNSVYIDGQIIPALYERGLILPHFRGDTGNRAMNEANDAVQARLGADFRHRADPVWNFPIDSREWRTLRSTLLAAAQIHSMGENTANQMIQEAQRLEDAIVIYLNER